MREMQTSPFRHLTMGGSNNLNATRLSDTDNVRTFAAVCSYFKSSNSLTETRNAWLR